MGEIRRQQQKIQMKTILLAVLIGVIVGALDALFGRVLLLVSEVRSEHVIGFVPFLGVAGVISVSAYKRYSEESLKGMELVIQTGLGQNEKIPILLVPLIMVGTWLTHLFGGSAGREGVAVQLGATISHAIGRKAKMPDNSRVLLITGMAGGVFAYSLRKVKGFTSKWIKSPIIRILVMGTSLAVVLLVLHYGRYCGLGTNLISYSFSGQKIYAYDWILKIILTVLTLSAGYQGGEVTPLFSIGASLGVVLASVLGLPIMLVAALGYAAVFGAATNTLLAPILVGIEVFGGRNMDVFVVVCIIAYICNGKQSIYGAQRRYTFQL